MNTYSVTGTYTYHRGPWEGSGQFAGMTIEAEDAATAAEMYRAEMIGRRDLAGLATERTYVCAVALTGPSDVFLDPLEGVAVFEPARGRAV